MSLSNFKICLANLSKEKLILAYYGLAENLEKYLFPLILLSMRVWIASVFWASGVGKLKDWQTTIFLFTHEHPVPLLSPELSAYIATAFELACPVLLTLGLASRFACVPLLAMTAVIQFTYMDLKDHYYWAMVLGTILSYGAGALSLDALIKNKLADKYIDSKNNSIQTKEE